MNSNIGEVDTRFPRTEWSAVQTNSPTMTVREKVIKFPITRYNWTVLRHHCEDELSSFDLVQAKKRIIKEERKKNWKLEWDNYITSIKI